MVGAALRFVALGEQSFGHDEAVTVGRVLRPGLGATLREVGSSERTPYLYYVAAWLWTRVFGVGAAGIRSLSALFGTLTIPVAFAAGRASVSERTGVVAAALVALDPCLVYYSQEARSYAPFALLAACSLWAFANALRSPTRRALAAWGATSALAIATHYFAVFLIAGEAAWLIVAVRSRRLPDRADHPRRRLPLPAADQPLPVAHRRTGRRRTCAQRRASARPKPPAA